MFKLDDFDFGIAADSSSLELENDVLTLEIVGIQNVVERLWENESHPWHWVLYAPRLYVRDLPFVQQESGSFRQSLTEEDYDECEIGLHVVEHFTVLRCTISFTGKVVRVQGVVERGLIDRDVPLQIEWDTERPLDDHPT